MKFEDLLTAEANVKVVQLDKVLKELGMNYSSIRALMTAVEIAESMVNLAEQSDDNEAPNPGTIGETVIEDATETMRFEVDDAMAHFVKGF